MAISISVLTSTPTEAARADSASVSERARVCRMMASVLSETAVTAAAVTRAPVFVHVRSRPLDPAPGVPIAVVQEVIANAAVTGAPLQIVHLHSTGLRDTPTLIDMVKRARARGMDITSEAYPYTAGSTLIGSEFFRDGWQERSGISYGDLQWPATGERLTKDSFERYRREQPNAAVVIHMIPEDVVDATRAELRLAMQDTDFAEDLRARLGASTIAGDIVVSSMTSGASTAAQQSVTNVSASSAPSHIIALEYRLAIFHQAHVNPKIALIAQVTAQVQSPDRKQMLHKATWTYCGQPYDFVQMGANNAALLRGQINMAAAVLAEAIPYDLFVSKVPRPLKGYCMDFSDLPSGTGAKAPGLL